MLKIYVKVDHFPDYDIHWPKNISDLWFTHLQVGLYAQKQKYWDQVVARLLYLIEQEHRPTEPFPPECRYCPRCNHWLTRDAFNWHGQVRALHCRYCFIITIHDLFKPKRKTPDSHNWVENQAVGRPFLFEDKPRRPLLRCDRCQVLRVHKFSRLLEECYVWRELWQCIVCNAERGWGTCDPLKVYRIPGMAAEDQRADLWSEQ